jgi:hypothetical protein
MLQKNPQASVFSMPPGNHPERFTAQFLEKEDGSTVYLSGNRQWPFRNQPVKQSQWMVLSRHFIHELMYNDFARILLAFCEHTVIPDEMYFLTFAKSGETNTSIIEGETTYFHFTGSNYHPDTLNVDQVKEIGNTSFFARKINFADLSIREFIDLRREKLDAYLGIVGYNKNHLDD